NSLICDYGEFEWRPPLAQNYCGQQAGREDERRGRVISLSGDADALDVLIEYRHQPLDLVNPIEEDTAVRRFDIAMPGANDVVNSRNGFHLSFHLSHFIAASSGAERRHRRSLRPGHLQKFPALAHAIAEWLVDECWNPRFDKRPGRLEVVFRVTVVNDQGVDLSHEFAWLFHDPGNLAFFRRLPGELCGLSPHADDFASGKFSITVENLTVSDGVRIFGADDADPDLFVLLSRLSVRQSTSFH